MKQLVVEESLQSLRRLANRSLWKNDADTPRVWRGTFILTGGLDEINVWRNMPGIRGEFGRCNLDDFLELGLVVFVPLECLCSNEIEIFLRGNWSCLENFCSALERT